MGAADRRRAAREEREREEAEAAASDGPAPTCWLCERVLGDNVVGHHAVPKSRGGRDTVPLHQICHQTLHARFTNSELARIGLDVEVLRRDEEIARFLKWVAGKPADFHAPTRKSR